MEVIKFFFHWTSELYENELWLQGLSSDISLYVETI